MKNKGRDYIICLCHKTTLGEIEDIIKNRNIQSLKELCEIAGVGDKCGGCREELEELITEIIN